MTGAKGRLLRIAVGLTANVSVAATAHAQSPRSPIIDNGGIFLDGKTFSITTVPPNAQTGAMLDQRRARELGPGALVFRSGDRLYIVAAPLALSLREMDLERQRRANLRYAGTVAQPGYREPPADDDYRKLKRMFEDNWIVKR